MCRVSVVIPVYNSERFLNETLDSLLNQTMPDWDCILVNDCSTDCSQNIIDEYVARDNRFLSFVLPENSGCADVPLGYGMEQATSPFCCLMGHDDVLEPIYFEKLLAKQAETNADIVTATMIYCAKELEGEIYRLPESSFDMSQVLTGREAFAKTIGGWQLPLNGMLYRKELNEGVTRGKHMNSDEFSSRQILFKASRVAFSDARYIYRQFQESISRKAAPRLWQRAFVDLQVVDFVKQHYQYDESIQKSAITSQFFNLVHLTAGARIEKLECKDRKLVVAEMRNAYEQTDKSLVQKFLPKHHTVFVKGCSWFELISTFYVIFHKMCGKKYEYK